MKKFTFQLTITENQLEGDEFWEDAIKNHPTGIPFLLNSLKDMCSDTNLLNEIYPDTIKLIKYEDL